VEKTSIDYEELHKLRCLGVSVNKLSKKYKCTRYGISSKIAELRSLGYDTSKHFTIQVDIDIHKLMDLYNDSKSSGEIATRLKIAAGTVRNIIRNLLRSGMLQLKKKCNDKIAIDRDEFISAYNACNSTHELMDIFCCSYTVILWRKRKYNLPDKKRNYPRSALYKDKVRFIKFYNNGLDYKRLSAVFHVHISTIARFAKRLIAEKEIQARQQPVAWPCHKVLRAEYIKRNGSHWWLAMDYNVSKTTITNKLAEMYRAGELPEYGTFKRKPNEFTERHQLFLNRDFMKARCQPAEEKEMG